MPVSCTSSDTIHFVLQIIVWPLQLFLIFVTVPESEKLKWRWHCSLWSIFDTCWWPDYGCRMVLQRRGAQSQ